MHFKSLIGILLLAVLCESVYAVNRCGTSFSNASKKCIKCPKGLDGECPKGNKCYAGLPNCKGGGVVEEDEGNEDKGGGGDCKPATGLSSAPGKCGSFKGCKNRGGTAVENLCPGSSSNQCCVPRRCRTPSGSGYCLPASRCKGKSVAGFCPGPSSTKCCVDIDPPGPSGKGCGSLKNPHKSRDKYACGSSGNCFNPRTKFIKDKIACAFPKKFKCSTYNGSSSSDHPGNAADCTPDAFNKCTVGKKKHIGDSLAKWLVDNASKLEVKYVIWYDQIWSASKASQGWRDYSRSDINSDYCTKGDRARLGHYDHVHISVK